MKKLPRICSTALPKSLNLSLLKGNRKSKVGGLVLKWTIDAKGVAEGNEVFFIVECRRYTTSKQNQEKVGGLAYRISDSGAAGGIIVSPFGLQEGGAKVAAAENIISVKLNADSTPTEFAFRFLDKLCLGIRGKLGLSAIVSPRYSRKCAKCGKNLEVSGNRLLCND